MPRGNLSLRTRLILAFTILIVTSASATILIGNVVFGQKVTEQALSMTERGLNVVEYNLRGKLQRFRQLTHTGARLAAETDSPLELCGALITDETPLDFILQVRPGTAPSLIRAGDPCAVSVLPMDALVGTPLEELVGDDSEAPVDDTGLGVIAQDTMTRLGYPENWDRGLFILGTAPIPGGGNLLLGALLNERTELLAAPLEVLWPRDVSHYAATIFLDDSRVATTLGDSGLGTGVDPVVRQRVLVEGEKYFGQAEVVDREYFAAYMPLRDFKGRTIGILGIGAERDVYVDLRNRTVTLFSSLIALGMIFGFIMTYLFAGWLVRPIGELAKGMDRVAGGDFSYKVRFKSTDELGALARAFNHMVRAVKERDIRLREMTDERLSQMEKQVSIGRLAAGVAHEVNNPLTSVLSLSMMMRKHMDDADPRVEDLDIVIEETNRCREIVRSLLDFARERPVEMRVIEIHQIIQETLVLTRRYPSMKQVETSLEASAEPIHVSCDPKQLQQVFTNVIINAAEAMDGGGGAIRIAVDEDSSGGYVVIDVRDDGKGMNRDHLSRVFAPFYTTKGTRKGTGLGLAVSLGIVQKHKGTIDIESQPGRGTNVSIHLPRVPANDPSGTRRGR